MRNYLLSISVLAVGIFFLLNEKISDLASLSDFSNQTEAIEPLTQADMFSQQAHLRTIDPFDIDIIPASKPVPEGFPLGSVFGMRKHPILNVDKMHLGVDFPAPSGTPILATATGKVRKIYSLTDSSSFGRCVVLEHDEIYCTLYAHMSGFAVKPGQIVQEGDTIGFVGSTGRSTNPHLHYEVIKDGERVNPRDYF
ncbi:M23 family metallopeptidase [Pontibacter sp. G13]|uniref:M23 family metallopeptidase n=1 Tax=Pontibacter sp. G13 TaxID=3074898 RepID=UPI00288BF4CD|nr:M23 family metallopeptidase [Pontibacter sp. G13]WNJ20416.1 M23 family metallopeptidase [Pontibacter sp. G13]